MPHGNHDLAPRLLHVYPHVSNHMPVFIVGNRKGLLEIKRAIENVLAGAKPGIAYVMVGDGEGYCVYVIPNNADWQDWEKIAVPYTDDDFMYASEDREDAIWPTQMLSEEEWERVRQQNKESK